MKVLDLVVSEQPRQHGRPDATRIRLDRVAHQARFEQAQPLGLVKRALDWSWREDLGQIEEGAGGRGDGDPVAAGGLRGG